MKIFNIHFNLLFLSYYFISLFRDRNDKTKDITRFKEAFILGGIGIQELEKVGKIWEAGEIDQRNGTKFWTACINVSMAQLTDNQGMIEMFKSNTSEL